MPQVSIVIPVKNGATYIRRVYDSISDSIFSSWELIFVNDNSTDNTTKLIGQLSVIDSRVKLIDNQSTGVVSARQVGATSAQSDYLLFVDVDDTIPQGALDNLTATLNKYPNADIIIGDVLDVDTKDHCSTSSYAYHTISSGSELFNWIVDNRDGHMWGKLIKRTLFLSLPLIPLGMRFCEDLVQMLQLAAMADGVRHCCKPTYCYYQTQGSACNSQLSKSQFAQRFYLLSVSLRRLIDIFAENQPVACRLKVLFLYYTRLFLLSNSRWGSDPDDLRSTFKRYLFDSMLYGDLLYNPRRRRQTRLVYFAPWLTSQIFLYQRRKNGQIK